MNTTTDATLGALVTDTPGAARVFERYGLDYCCGGGQSLAEACAAASTDPSDVVRELAILGDEPVAAWSSMAPSELVDHLEATHHRYLTDEMPRLSALAAKVEDVHRDRHPELADVRSVFDALRAELEPHLAKEEQILFPMIRELSRSTGVREFHCGSIGNPIAVMATEHEQAGELLGRLRELTDGYETPADSCASYDMLYAGLAELEADTHLHIHIENNILFPAAVVMESAATNG